jgi:hypothetical protein
MLRPSSEEAASMTVDPADIVESLRLLRVAPLRIAAATEGADAGRLHLRTDAEPWSVNDVLAHIRSAADVRERSIGAMATGQRATVRYVSPRSELRTSGYMDTPFAENFAAFRARREGLIERLERLPVDGWSRGSLIRDRPETVATYVRYLVEHEAVHCDQIEQLVAGLAQEQAGAV